ncbi:preprotein translocase subunit SecE [Patescibacteria group bacterium]|nr:preprotein translocase subunit SecE [Patescibacteria group bacterium]
MKNSFVQYFIDSYQELHKVTWPTRNQAMKLTAIVLGFCLFMAILIGAVDGLFSTGYQYLINLT